VVFCALQPGVTLQNRIVKVLWLLLHHLDQDRTPFGLGIRGKSTKENSSKKQRSRKWTPARPSCGRCWNYWTCFLSSKLTVDFQLFFTGYCHAQCQEIEEIVAEHTIQQNMILNLMLEIMQQINKRQWSPENEAEKAEKCHQNQNHLTPTKTMVRN
jgi:hypothetical protein